MKMNKQCTEWGKIFKIHIFKKDSYSEYIKQYM